jgi:hypothetical protein
MDNYVIYNRNNKQLELCNHIDKDGDLDAQYALLRNNALTGKFVKNVFVSDNNKTFRWLVDCADKGCPTCSGIFVNVKNNNYNIREFYLNNVVEVKIDINKAEKQKAKHIPTKFDSLAKNVVNKDKEHKHPLEDYIRKVFQK